MDGPPPLGKANEITEAMDGRRPMMEKETPKICQISITNNQYFRRRKVLGSTYFERCKSSFEFLLVPKRR